FNMSMNVVFFIIKPISRLAGAKVSIFFKLTRLFEIIFEFISNPSFYSFSMCFSSLAGCKYKNLLSPNPNKNQTFFNLFFKTLKT
ncbi:hypothetical protein, partial [Flavobacterium rivulicola]|uniref:hypothetical protein n=1 Tax=Flavobacterium rivulicola TaxID=2732161 RepID=UPI00197FB196